MVIQANGTTNHLSMILYSLGLFIIFINLINKIYIYLKNILEKKRLDLLPVLYDYDRIELIKMKERKC